MDKSGSVQMHESAWRRGFRRDRDRKEYPDDILGGLGDGTPVLRIEDGVIHSTMSEGVDDSDRQASMCMQTSSLLVICA